MGEKEKGLTVQIPEKLHTELKILAATLATTVKDIVIRGIESELEKSRKIK